MPKMVDRNSGKVQWAIQRGDGFAMESRARPEQDALASPSPLSLPGGLLDDGSRCDQVTVAAPLPLRQGSAAFSMPVATWIEAWMPQTAYKQLHPGQSAHIGLTGAGSQYYGHIDGTVTDVVSGNSPGVLGSPRFCRVRIRPMGGFFVGDQTYHPLLPGVSIQVALRTAAGTLMSLLAAVRSQPE